MNTNYRNPKNAAAISKYWNKNLDSSDWYKIQDQENDIATVWIYDALGWPFISADEFAKDLDKIKADTILCRINSPGGNVFDGLAVMNSLKNHSAKVITRIEGLAASIASVVALAGDEVQINSGAMLMIHDPWIMTVGNEKELRHTADVLSQIGGNLRDIYCKKTGIDEAEIESLMASESWFTASECKQRGFVDTVLDGSAEAISNKFDLSMFTNAPQNFHKEKPRNEKMTKREIERALRDAGASRAFAKSIAAGCRDTSDIDQQDADDEEAVKNLIAKITSINGGH